MGLMDRLNKPEAGEQEPVLEDRSTILAYLEELAQLRTPVSIWLQKDDLMPLQAKVELVDEDKGLFTVSVNRSIPADLDARFPKEMLFAMDGMRFRAPARYQGRGGYMQVVFKVPEKVYHAERRDKMRARFGQREKAHATVLGNLFKGTGVSGRLLDLSTEGLCMLLERAIAIPGDRRLPISTSLFEQGQELMIVRILDLPHAPMVECSGRVCYLKDSSEGVRMGLYLQGLGSTESQILHQVMKRRLPTFDRDFPRKLRRKDMLIAIASERQEEMVALRSDSSDEEDAGFAESPAMLARGAEPGPDAKDHLLLIKKRGKRILLIQCDDLDRAIIAGTLHVDGYRQVKEARSFVEALQASRVALPDLIIIEQQIGQHSAQDFLEKLRKQAGCPDTPVVMLSDSPGVRTTIMAKAARIAHVVPCPVDYDGELKGVLLKLLKIE